VNIKSDIVSVSQPKEKVFDFLKDYNNYQKLMPEQVVKWESDERSGRFTIKDMTELGMRIEDAKPGEYVLLHSDGKVPFEFTLKVVLDEKGENLTDVNIVFDGNPAPLIAMMAKRTLTNLVNHMVSQLPLLVTTS
jgi:carbon monoxide dehydrogenase subunit G